MSYKPIIIILVEIGTWRNYHIKYTGIKNAIIKMSFMVNNSIRVSSCDTQCNHTYGRRPDTRNEVSLDTLGVYRRVIIIIGFDLNFIFSTKQYFWLICYETNINVLCPSQFASKKNECISWNNDMITCFSFIFLQKENTHKLYEMVKCCQQH